MRTCLAALAVLLAMTVVTFAPLWRAGPRESLAIEANRPLPSGDERVVWAQHADAIYQAWLVSRHARTLTSAPWRLFDTPHCAPIERSLRLSIPMATLGFLAIPAWIVSGDPILTYNLTLVLVVMLAALAMFGLVFAWTGSVGAAIVAGLLFGFHPYRVQNLTHPSVWDTTWTVLALAFAARWFASGRWRDAVGLTVATGLQIGASFYPLLGAAIATPPFLLWLVRTYGVRRITPGQVAFVAAGVTLAVIVFLVPYLDAPSEDGGLHRAAFVFAAWSDFAPGRPLDPRLVLPLLAASAFLVPRGALAGRLGKDPRWALLAGAVLAIWFAIGPAGGLPDLHGLLARVVPGLDAVRVIQRVAADAQLLLAVLAGLGAAYWIRRSGSRAWIVASLLVVLAALDVARSGPPDDEGNRRWKVVAARPSQAQIDFFAELERRGNAGPLFELPVDTGLTNLAGPPRILLEAWHRRRTSACFGSYEPKGRSELARWGRELPAPEAVRALAKQGFTTLVVHTGAGTGVGPAQRRAIERAAGARGMLSPIFARGPLQAYAIHPDPAGSAAASGP